MNDAPRILDRSGATINRLRVILFNRTIPKDEQNPNLLQQLEREKAGVFNWLIAGYKRLLEQGEFTEPEQSKRWLAEYRLQNDPEALFLSEWTTPNPSLSTCQTAICSLPKVDGIWWIPIP
jgi:putative DNA primase/helicase